MIISIRHPNFGQHLIRRYSTFDHHGIGQDDGTVVEYGGKWTGSASIRRITLEAFANGGDVLHFVYPSDAMLSLEETVRRSRLRLTEEQYSLFDNNCEHFAFWCKTGRHMSPQADNLRGAIGAGLVIAGGFFAAKLIVEASKNSKPPRSRAVASNRKRVRQTRAA